MLIRIAELDNPLPDPPEVLDRFRAWMAERPGILHAWHATDVETGKTISVSVWDGRASLEALEDQHMPGGPIKSSPDRVKTYENVIAFPTRR